MLGCVAYARWLSPPCLLLMLICNMRMFFYVCCCLGGIDVCYESYMCWCYHVMLRFGTCTSVFSHALALRTPVMGLGLIRLYRHDW